MSNPGTVIREGQKVEPQREKENSVRGLLIAALLP